MKPVDRKKWDKTFKYGEWWHSENPRKIWRPFEALFDLQRTIFNWVLDLIKHKRINSVDTKNPDQQP